LSHFFHDNAPSAHIQRWAQPSDDFIRVIILVTAILKSFDRWRVISDDIFPFVVFGLTSDHILVPSSPNLESQRLSHISREKERERERGVAR
jgi:hypothetical protein